jgi:hypothetical protein
MVYCHDFLLPPPPSFHRKIRVCAVGEKGYVRQVRAQPRQQESYLNEVGVCQFCQ